MRCSGNYRKCVLCHCSLPKKCQQTPKDPKEFQKTPKGPQKTPEDPQRPPKDPKRPPNPPTFGSRVFDQHTNYPPPYPLPGPPSPPTSPFSRVSFLLGLQGVCFTRRGVCLFVCPVVLWGPKAPLAGSSLGVLGWWGPKAPLGGSSSGFWGDWWVLGWWGSKAPLGLSSLGFWGVSGFFNGQGGCKAS